MPGSRLGIRNSVFGTLSPRRPGVNPPSRWERAINRAGALTFGAAHPSPLPLARALRNCVRERGGFCMPQAQCRERKASFSRLTDSAWRWRSCRPLYGTQHHPSFEVHGEAQKSQMCPVACQTEIAGARQAVDALETSEDLLYRGAAPSPGFVKTLLTLGQRMMLVGPEHQPRLDTSGGQAAAPLVLVIGLIGINRLLVAADQLVGRNRIVDGSVGQLGAANDRRSLVDADMSFVAKVPLAALLGPSRIRIALAVDQFARCMTVRARRLRIFRRLWPLHGRRYQTRVDQRALPQHQPARVDLMQDLGEQFLVQTSPLQGLAEAPDRRVVRRLIAQHKATKFAERGAVIERLFKRRIGQPIPLLQQQNLEHHEPRIGWRASLRLRKTAQHALHRRPIDQFANPSQHCSPFTPPRYQRIR